MNRIAKLSQEDRRFIFLTTSQKTGKSFAVIEKDYWVCYLIDYLFTKSDFKDLLIFKGGTSLSKGFELINRMSEDIDLILNWKALGEEYNLDAIENDDSLSKTKLDKIKKEITLKTNRYLKDEFAPKLSKGIKEDLGYEINVSCVDENGGIVIYIDYPKNIKDDYLREVVKLEIGPLAALTPTQIVEIKPYCYDDFSSLFTKNSILVNTVKPERTFWEKATILHREYCRPKEKPMPVRYFRHYYDLYMLGKSLYKDLALNNKELLTAVVHFKQTFYKETWMDYFDILKNGIHLIPDDYRFKDLKEDYNKMKEMIIAIIPFDEIMENLKFLELKINDQNGFMPGIISELLSVILKSKMSIVVSGVTGTGKTEFQKYLINFVQIPDLHLTALHRSSGQ